MKTAEEYFEKHEPHDPNVIIAGQRVSKARCIQLMEEYASQNTLDREKVMEILKQYRDEPVKFLDEYRIRHAPNEIPDYERGLLNKYTDAICSLALSSVSEEEIRKLYFDNSYFDDYGDWYMNIEGFKAAIKELLNQK